MERICEFNQRSTQGSIFEVYGSLPNAGFAAGRSSLSLPQPTQDEFATYVQLSQVRGITFNYTFNGSCLGALEYDTSWRTRLYEFVEYLHSIGVSAFTVSSPALVAILRHQLPTSIITVSITADVRTRQSAIDYCALGANKVMASISLYRRLEQLRHLATTSDIEVGILLNSFCFPDCTYRTEHFNTSSHLGGVVPSLYDKVGSFDFNHCALAKLTSPKQFLRAVWVRPEDVVHYENVGISFFKLEGRQREEFDAVKAAAIYCGRNYDGNLCNLHTLFSKSTLPSILYIDNRQLQGFLTKFMSGFPCDEDTCRECGHCADYARRAIRVLDDLALKEAIHRVQAELETFIEYGR